MSNETLTPEESQRAADTAFATALVTNAILLVVFMAGFLIFIHLRRCRKAYVAHDDVPAPPRGLFGWAKGALSVTDDELEVKRGLDFVAYLKTLKYLFWICMGYMVYGFAVLTPIHATGGNNQTGISMIGMGNVPDGDARLAADIVGVFVNSFFAFFVLYRLYRTITHLRIRSKARVNRPENYTILIRDIPPLTTEAQLRNFFEKAFPAQVAHVQLGHRTPGLWTHLKDRITMGLKEEQMQAHLLVKGERKIVRDKKPLYACCGNKVDGIDFFQQRYEEETAICATKAERAAVEAKYAGVAAFVTFKSISAAQMASQVVFAEQRFAQPLEKQFIVEPAPAPETVAWASLHVTHAARFVRCVIVNILIFLLIFFWMIPVAFASGLANTTTLSTVLPFLVPLLDASAVIRGFIEGFLPGLVLIIFFAILVSLIITPLAKAEGQLSDATVQRSVFNKYWLFLVFNVFLGSILASGFFNVLAEIIENPASIAALLAESLPKQVYYFLSYVMILSLSGFGMALWRVVGIIVIMIKAKLNKTKRAQRAIAGPYVTNLAPAYSRHCIIFLIVSVYSTINPLILPFGAIYFGMAYLSERYNVVYVYTPVSPCEASWWPSVFTRLVWGVIVFQFSVAAVLGLAGFPYAAIIFIGFIATILLWIWADRQLHRHFKYGVVNFMAQEPLLNQIHDKGEGESVFPVSDTYMYPSMRKPLFNVETQDPAVDAPADFGWWPYEFQRNVQDAPQMSEDPSQMYRAAPEVIGPRRASSPVLIQEQFDNYTVAI